MRMYKKAAAALLAAAMALSMMTACGGGSGSGSGVVSGATYTSTAALAAGVDADSATNVTPIEASKSRYAEYVKQSDSSDKTYTRGSSAYIINGQMQATVEEIQAKSGNFEYYKDTQGANVEEALSETVDGGEYEYYFFEASEGKAAVRMLHKHSTGGSEDTGSSGTTVVPPTMESAQVTVANVSYYAEILKSGETTITLCYEGNKAVPTYRFIDFGSGFSTAEVYNEVCIGSDKNVIANRLSGCTVYTATEESKTKGTLKNETTGVTYEVTYGEGDKGYTVKKNGQETDEIDWLIKAIMKEMPQD